MDLRVQTFNIAQQAKRYETKEPQYPVFNELDEILDEIYQLNNADIDYNITTNTDDLLKLCKVKLAELLNKFVMVLYDKDEQITRELANMKLTDMEMYDTEFKYTFANLNFVLLDDLIYAKTNGKPYTVENFAKSNFLYMNMDFQTRVIAFISYIFMMYDLEPTKLISNFNKVYIIKK